MDAECLGQMISSMKLYEDFKQRATVKVIFKIYFKLTFVKKNFKIFILLRNYRGTKNFQSWLTKFCKKLHKQIREEDRELFSKLLRGNDIENCINAIPVQIGRSQKDKPPTTSSMPRIQSLRGYPLVRLDVFLSVLKVKKIILQNIIKKYIT